MDERYTEREKIAMRRRRKQKKRKRVFILMCFILCCAGLTLLVFKAPFFKITKVVCEGENILAEKQIIAKSQIEKGRNIFSVSMSKTKERIMELSYVSEVNVKRVFPATVKITVKECKPRAYIAYEKKFALIDYSGKILEMPKTNDKYKVMTIKGVKIKSPEIGGYIKNEDDKRIKYCTDALEILEKNKLIEKVKEIDLTRITGIKINYDNRIYANCGSYGNYDNFSYKLNILRHLINEEISEYEKVEVDLTMEETVVRPYEDEETKKKRLEEEKAKREANKKAEESENDDGEKTEESEESENEQA